jgi:Cu/Ag efflux protein CusF
MKKNTIISAVSGLALVLVSGTLALAASDETNPSSKAVPSAVVEKQTEMNKLNGEIASIDRAKKMVTVKTKRNGKEITVAAQLDDRTAIMDGRNSKSFADLKVGERVRMYYERQDNRELARNILVQPSVK